jgi:hypothetical protein
MIDSVCLTLPIQMHSPPVMTALGFRSNCRHPSPDCSHPARWHWQLATKPRLTWSEAPNGMHWLSAAGSLPKFMFGSNTQLFSSEKELQISLHNLSAFVSDVAQVRFDAFAANVTRVDYCHDWRLTSELVTEYLWALRRISLGRMKKHLIDNETVELRNKSQTIIFYDKFKERSAMRLTHLCSSDEVLSAEGVLRMEVRFRDNRSCQRHAKRIGAERRSAESLLLGDAAHRTVSRAIQRLGLNKPITSGALRYQILRDYCGKDGAKYVRLAGFLTLSDIHGLENLVPLGICSYSDYCRKLAEVKAAGVLYAIGKKRRSLPPLNLSPSGNLGIAVQVA